MKTTSIVISVSLFLSGCVVYRPDLTEKHVALSLIDQGVIALRQGQVEEAEAAFEAAHEIGHLPAALDGLGAVAFLKGVLDQAEQFFRTAYQSGDHYPQAIGNLALLYERRGDLGEANRLYLQALKEDPANYKIRGNFSSFLAEYTDEGLDAAKEELLKAWVIGKHELLTHNRRRLGSKNLTVQDTPHGKEPETF